jgi:hypothetical protein
MRVTCSESMVRYATPAVGAEGGREGDELLRRLGPREDGPLWDPGFRRPVFLAKLENFLKAMAARYDGNPNVAYIDIGSFGLWGEGHTVASSHVPQEQTREIVKQHIDLHTQDSSADAARDQRRRRRHDDAGHALPRNRLRARAGVTLRDDSIMVWPPPKHWYHAEMAQAFWPKLPVILEHDHLERVEDPPSLGRRPPAEGRRGLPRQLPVDPLVAAGVPAEEPRDDRQHQPPDRLPAISCAR